jgi:hypothetical protein
MKPCHRHKGAQSKCDHADDDCGLGNQLGFDFEGKFHAPKQWGRIKNKEELEEEGGEGTRAKGRNLGTVPMAEVTATAHPIFLARALKPTMRK